MLPVEEARRRILESLRPMGAETVPVSAALGRVLAADVVARLTQPPTAVSAMDGYAVRGADVAEPPVVLRQVGAVPAGTIFQGKVGAEECVRIFTGAALPEGADTIIIQENTRADGARITVLEAAPIGRYVRPSGLDFRTGDVALKAGEVLSVRKLALAAAMNHPWLSVTRKPRVAILATGDEVVMPGEAVGPGRIVSSNGLALAAFVQAWGGEPIQLGIAPDRIDALQAMVAGAEGADLVVTTGGASVGDHDLVRAALLERGLELDFWQIAMRPGKPLMFGRIGNTPLLGLPGNPVSSFVCSVVFLQPALQRLAGAPVADDPTEPALTGSDLAANDHRQDYLRATLKRTSDGHLVATAFSRQDSSMLHLLARAECLLVRKPHEPQVPAGHSVPVIRLHRSMVVT
ncbi:MAG: molybdopterin molybdotransferase MoeA [Alphaproteobacteria bacterium]|nr:molybdopterin molybdotransferase MoeA [Alphaproteobacteria bacterium]